MSMDKNFNYYHIYQPKERRYFIGEDVAGYTTVAASKPNGPGTYMAIYCSAHFSLQQLGKHIAKGTKQLDNNTRWGFHHDISKEYRYRDIYEKSFKTQHESHILPMSELLQVQGFSRSLIYSLAFQGKFILKDVNNVAITPKWTYARTIRVDHPFYMTDVVLDNKFLLPTEKHGLLTVLAWYQGNLNVFQKDRQSNTWNPVKRSLHNENDYHYIIDFLAMHYAEIGIIRSALERACHTPGSPSSSHHRLGNDNICSKQIVINQQLEHLEKKNMRFTEAGAYGLIGPLKGWD
ncbi:unnamed protein product [Blumeria hordei]|uniref:Uncharacterized protein n=1 Tax=Blumeria hordei TaxID=2867405 RepID=A0A383UZU7_BLUHO|nr:unnamed protein product [Blumeria hordei]